jgi:crotonobetainyl-CoA:carnitine CoA-transferase CaiB-like acyl-CoA transferase
MSGPLEGVRVLDLTTVVMGPYATQLLGDYGADVIKVESPDGDVMRLSGPMRNPRMGHLYLTTNRSKRSVVIDLKKPAGRDVLLGLAKTADALVYNIRPQAMARLGLGYEDVRAANSRIVYVGAFGFSQRGPYAARAAYDDLIQGMAGIPWLAQRAGSGEPRYAPVILADRMVGLQLAYAIAAALLYRERSGEGQRVDVPMFEGLASVVLGEHLAGRLFVPAEGPEGYQRSLTAGRRPYRTLDGYICILIYTDKQWRKFLALVGEPQRFENDARFSSQGNRLRHIDEVYGYLGSAIATRTTAEWLELLEAADIPAARMYSIDDILADEHLAAIGYFTEAEHPSEGRMRSVAVPTEWSKSPPAITRHAPLLGENTAEVLREAGYSEADVQALASAGVIGLAG